MSNRFYRSERHASLSLEADTRPSYRISHELHDADFGVLPGARSESVGADFESRYDADSLPLLRWLGVAIALIVGSIVLAVLFGGPKP